MIRKLYLYFIVLSIFLISNCGVAAQTDASSVPSPIISIGQLTEYSTPDRRIDL